MNIDIKILYKILVENGLKNNHVRFIPGVQRWFNIRKSITKFPILKGLSFLREMADPRAGAKKMQNETE